MNRQLTAVRDLLEVLSAHSELELDPVFERILSEGSEALGAGMAAMHLADNDAGVLALVAAHRLDPVRARAWQRLNSKAGNLQAVCCAESSPRDLCGNDAPGGMERVLCAPIKGRDTVVGCLTLIWENHPGEPSADQAVFAEAMGLLLGLAIEHSGLVSEMMDSLGNIMSLKAKEEERGRQLDEVNQRLLEVNQILARLSTTDELTGLANRRHLMNRLEREIARWKRQGNPLCLLIADLDHFKRLNDTLGHQAGDEALKLFAEIVRNGVREVDIVGRYGGEEFVVALTGCSLSQGRKVAEKLRAAVEQGSNRPPFAQLGGFTVSMGIAQMQPGMDVHDIIALADQALYAAKHNGRNRVMAPADQDFTRGGALAAS